MYRGVIYAGDVKRVYYLDSDDEEQMWDWLGVRAEGICERIGADDYELNLEENYGTLKRDFSDYVPFVTDDGTIEKIWFDSYDEAKNYSEWIGSEPRYGKVEPTKIDTE